MNDILIDYSTSRPSVQLLQSVGVTGVGRYLGWDSVPGYSSIGKNLSTVEADTLLKGGISIFLSFEYLPDAAARGANQGRADGLLAIQQLRDLGAPSDMAVYFSVDFDIPDYAPGLPSTPDHALAKLGPVGQYFQAIQSLRPSYGVSGYGGFYAISRLFDAGLIRYGWQTIAWSGGQVDPRAQILQVVETSPVFDTDVDIREHTSTGLDYGQWPRPTTPPLNPIPKEKNMLIVHVEGQAEVYLFMGPGALYHITSVINENNLKLAGIPSVTVDQAQFDVFKGNPS